ncbi:MAG: DUF4055 domain-containing protein [Aquiluna sp.]
MIDVPNSIILSADDLPIPFDRREPETERVYAEVTDVDAYSIDQAEQVARILPIRFCTLPEFYLDEAIDNYIPRDYQEHEGSYNVRKTRAMTCFEPFYSHYVDIIVGTALRKGVILPQDLPEEWEKFFSNVNLEGKSITSFAKTLFTEALNGGIAGLMADFPRVATRDRADQRRMGLRPYFTIIKVDDILDCRHESGPLTINGVTSFETKVTYLRIKSEIRRASATNEHYEEVVPTVVVYDLPENGGNVRVRVYEKNVSGHPHEYFLPPDGEMELSIDYIPFVPCYGGKEEAFCRARPLLFDIARLNLHHWATCADLAETIHLNSSPLLTATGVRPDDEIYAGSGRSLFSQNENARFGMVSPGMDGAETTLKELARIESAMDRLAAIAIAPGKSQVESGFAKLLDRSQSDSQLAVLIGSLQDCFNRALWYASGYMTDLYPPIEVTISKNFIPAKLHSQQVMALSSLYKDAEAVPIGTFLEMLEAGEMFEGVHGFNVKTLLDKMGLTGTERRSEITKPATPNNSRIYVENTMEEASGMALEGEPSEPTGEQLET